jgi:hypothetical protein
MLRERGSTTTGVSALFTQGHLSRAISNAQTLRQLVEAASKRIGWIRQMQSVFALFREDNNIYMGVISDRHVVINIQGIMIFAREATQ